MVGLVYTLQHFRIADVVHQIEVGYQMGKGPWRIISQDIAGFLQTIYVVVLKEEKVNGKYESKPFKS